MANADGPPAERAFDLLSDETRVGIVRALADRLRENPDDPTLGFAELRRRVGVRDSGNFNYHLEKVEGRFVAKTEEGYRIAPAGIEVVAALVTGVYGADAELGPVELEDACPACEEPFTATYADGVLVVDCPNDHEFRNALPPGAVEDRALAEVVDLLTLKTRQDLEMAIERICPFCYARLDWTADVDPESPIPAFDAQCSRCGVLFDIPLVVSLLGHPRVAAFYYDHGIDVRTRPLWASEFVENVTVERTAAPLRFHVGIALEDGTLEATLDDDLAVVDVHASDPP